MERNAEENVVMRTWKMEVGGHRKIGRPKLRWSDVIRKDTKEKGVKIEGAQGLRIEIENSMSRPHIGKKAK